jgi:hypothetical protein
MFINRIRAFLIIGLIWLLLLLLTTGCGPVVGYLWSG